LQTSKRVQVYLSLLQVFRWPTRIPKTLASLIWMAGSVWRAIWLGLLDSEELNQVTRAYYMGSSGFEEQDFNVYQGLWPWEASAHDNHLKGYERVLVAGAGGGREVIALARLGHEVTAFDFSTYLTEACRRNLLRAGCSAHVLDAPPNGLPNGLDMYDALWIGRGFYHHIPGRMRRISFLEECRKSLVPGASIFMSDFFTRATHSSFHKRTQFIANICRQVRLEGEKIDLGDWLSICYQHAFTAEEIEQEFLSAGLNLDIFAVTPFSADSHLAHVVGHRE
jgi:SAM-dependent methyltransferase